MSQPRPTDPIGSIGWTERTGGVLTARECLTLARPLLRGELSILAGRLAMVLRMHSGRRSSIDPASLVPPDSPLARDAEVAAQDLLTPALLNHSSRAYTWGAAIAALHGITFDRELLYLAAMFHDTGIPSPVPDVDFTVRSAALAREFTDSHDVPADIRELVANAIAMHYTPGVGLESGAEAYLLSAGAAVDVFGLRSNEIPDAVRQSVIQEYPRLGFKREFAGLLRAEAKQVPRGRAWYLHRFAMSDLSIRLAPFRALVRVRPALLDRLGPDLQGAWRPAGGFVLHLVLPVLAHPGDPAGSARASVAEDHPLRRPLALDRDGDRSPLSQIRCRRALGRHQSAPHLRRSARLRLEPLRPPAPTTDRREPATVVRELSTPPGRSRIARN